MGLTGAGSGKSTLASALLAEILAARNSGRGSRRRPLLARERGRDSRRRVRMQQHALDDAVFIRHGNPGHLGGLGPPCRSCPLLDATGWPLVNRRDRRRRQVEVEVAATCDTVVVVVVPAGETRASEQGRAARDSRRPGHQQADRPGVEETARDLRLMLQLSEPSSGRRPSSRLSPRAERASPSSGMPSPRTRIPRAGRSARAQARRAARDRRSGSQGALRHGPSRRGRRILQCRLVDRAETEADGPDEAAAGCRAGRA